MISQDNVTASKEKKTFIHKQKNNVEKKDK